MNLAQKIYQQTEALQSAATGLGITITTAESCTGGLLGSIITARPGSSSYFLGGVVTYSNQSKETLLGVSHETLMSFGAVSKDTAIAMARGVRTKLNATIGISITGVAGPGGGTEQKPVGTVWLGLSSQTSEKASLFSFEGDREQIRLRAAEEALNMLQEQLQDYS